MLHLGNCSGTSACSAQSDVSAPCHLPSAPLFGFPCPRWRFRDGRVSHLKPGIEDEQQIPECAMKDDDLVRSGSIEFQLTGNKKSSPLRQSLGCADIKRLSTWEVSAALTVMGKVTDLLYLFGSDGV